MYVPAYGMASIVCILPLPTFTLWRFLSSVAVIGGTLLMLFLAWTFHGLENADGLELHEAKNLLPVRLTFIHDLQYHRMVLYSPYHKHSL
ncbi:unnamed protein product [Haemonchus placei]|uniref:Aa_trans domain-containing protein n=1 Tax=Haemonchus placei TaxID=6290 RepID=A0A0N4WJ37_HAEPC|nr:unnamed protein product [Haemonchus placei]